MIAVPSTTDGAATSAQRSSGIPRLWQPYQLARNPPIMPPYATSPPRLMKKTSDTGMPGVVIHHSTRDPMIDQIAVHM